MRHLEAVTEHEMVAHWLKSEMHSVRFEQGIATLLEREGQDRRIIEEPDLHDPEENGDRAWLHRLCRTCHHSVRRCSPTSGGVCQSGGDEPMASQMVRKRSRWRLFSCSASTVSRPLRVRPSMVCWSAAQRKCRNQLCLRG